MQIQNPNIEARKKYNFVSHRKDAKYAEILNNVVFLCASAVVYNPK